VGQRKFSFVHPPWILADFIERLRGVLLDVLVVLLDDERAHRQVEGDRSIHPAHGGGAAVVAAAGGVVCRPSCGSAKAMIESHERHV
jgi:hypothetical protein